MTICDKKKLIRLNRWQTFTGNNNVTMKIIINVSMQSYVQLVLVLREKGGKQDWNCFYSVY